MSVVFVTLLVSKLGQSTAKVYFTCSQCIAIAGSDSSESMKVTISGGNPSDLTKSLDINLNPQINFSQYFVIERSLPDCRYALLILMDWPQ